MAGGAALRASDLGYLGVFTSSIVWSPRSNLSLYGDTVDVTTADQLGVRLALGADWTPTGSMDMLRELPCADEFNRRNLAGYFSDEKLWLMATRQAAVAAGATEVGSLAPGQWADLAIFERGAAAGHRAVIGAAPERVAFVARGGKALYGDAALLAALSAQPCDPITVCGSEKAVCAADAGTTLAALQAANGASAPLFSCAPAPTERTCVPARPAQYTGQPVAGDADGDGIADAIDNCPSIFNPILPVDHGAQADADADGRGDACDPTPLGG